MAQRQTRFLSARFALFAFLLLSVICSGNRPLVTFEAPRAIPEVFRCPRR